VKKDGSSQPCDVVRIFYMHSNGRKTTKEIWEMSENTVFDANGEMEKTIATETSDTMEAIKVAAVYVALGAGIYFVSKRVLNRHYARKYRKTTEK